MVRRLAVVATGVVLAFGAGCLFLLAALLARGAGLSVPEALAALHALALLAAAGGADPGQAAGSLLAGMEAAALRLCLLPVSVTALAGEVAGARSWAVTAGITAIVTVLASMPGAGMPEAILGNPRALAELVLLGTITGSTYWLVTGRKVTRPARTG